MSKQSKKPQEKAECKICGKKYADKYVLNNHTKSKHGVNPYPCKYKFCDKVFEKSEELKLHQKIDHLGLSLEDIKSISHNLKKSSIICENNNSYSNQNQRNSKKRNSYPENSNPNLLEKQCGFRSSGCSSQKSTSIEIFQHFEIYEGESTNERSNFPSQQDISFQDISLDQQFNTQYQHYIKHFNQENPKKMKI